MFIFLTVGFLWNNPHEAHCIKHLIAVSEIKMTEAKSCVNGFIVYIVRGDYRLRVSFGAWFYLHIHLGRSRDCILLAFSFVLLLSVWLFGCVCYIVSYER